jgi:hypothetical protein
MNFEITVFHLSSLFMHSSISTPLHWSRTTAYKALAQAARAFFRSSCKNQETLVTDPQSNKESEQKDSSQIKMISQILVLVLIQYVTSCMPAGAAKRLHIFKHTHAQAPARAVVEQKAPFEARITVLER